MFFYFQVLRGELESQQNKIAVIQGDLVKLGSQYQSTEALSLTKDISVLNKKHDAALQKAKKVCVVDNECVPVYHCGFNEVNVFSD